MDIVATQIRVGHILRLDNDLYKVTWTQHVTPGKGVACMQTKLKNIINGKNLEKRFRSADRVEKVSVREIPCQYLYQDSSGFIFMDNESFEQHTLSKELVGDDDVFLVEGDDYKIAMYESQVVGLLLPTTVDLKVTMAPPTIKKATATTSFRAVTLENNMEVPAPNFVKEGDTIRINTETREYVERVT